MAATDRRLKPTLASASRPQLPICCSESSPHDGKSTGVLIRIVRVDDCSQEPRGWGAPNWPWMSFERKDGGASEENWTKVSILEVIKQQRIASLVAQTDAAPLIPRNRIRRIRKPAVAQAASTILRISSYSINGRLKRTARISYVTSTDRVESRVTNVGGSSRFQRDLLNDAHVPRASRHRQGLQRPTAQPRGNASTIG